MNQVISIDAESNGLGGRAFCVAMTLSTVFGEQDKAVFRCPIGELFTDNWVEQNVLPGLADVPENCPGGYPQLLAEVFKTYTHWGGRPVPMITHVPWPVEARLLLDVFNGSDIRHGPYPLIDVASILLAKGHNPLTVDGYLDAHNIARPEGSPHHPLYDARATERCYRHLMAERQQP